MMAGMWETLSQPLIQRLGWMLLHFVWQGTCVALVLALALAAMRQRSPNARYMALCIGLLVMATLPVATFFLLPPLSQPAATSTTSNNNRTQGCLVFMRPPFSVVPVEMGCGCAQYSKGH